MSQLQEDPTNTATECYDMTASMNAQILSMFDVELYILQGAPKEQVKKQFSIAYNKLSQEMKSCVTKESVMLYGLPRF